jgi:GntR family transcriptional regulator/MocR family aminotransferase
LIAAKLCADWNCAVIGQLTLAAFIAEGHLARHVRKMRNVYAGRRDLLLSTLRRDFEGMLFPVESAAGLHLTALSRPGVNDVSLARRAARDGVRLYALSEFYAKPPGRSGIVFGYGGMEERAIAAGLAQLRRAWKR